MHYIRMAIKNWPMMVYLRTDVGNQQRGIAVLLTCRGIEDNNEQGADDSGDQR